VKVASAPLRELVRRGKVQPGSQGGAQVGDGLVQVALFRQCDPQVSERFGMAGVEAYGLPVVRDRLFSLTLARQRVS
jgi:hypothetical protein